MIDLSIFISALKTTWLHRMFIYSNAPWVNLTFYNVGPIDKLFKLGPENINKIINRTTNKFWVEILHSWRRVMAHIPISDTQSALSETLWLNPKISKAHLFLPNWYRKGINLPADLIHANGDFMTGRTLKTKYHIETNLLEYHRVITCVHAYLSNLKITSKVHQKPNIPNHIRLLLKSKNGSKDFYRTMIDNLCGDAKQSFFWKQTLLVN